MLRLTIKRIEIEYISFGLVEKEKKNKYNINLIAGKKEGKRSHNEG